MEGPAGGTLQLRKGNLKVEVVLVEGIDEMAEPELGRLLDRNTSADRTIVASLGRFTASAHQLAEDRRVQLWNRTRLEEEAGRMLLAEVDTREVPIADESLLEPFLKGGVPEPCGHDTGGEDGIGEVDGAETFGASGKPAPDIVLPDGEAAVAPAISQERAGELVAERLEGAFRFDLQMMPNYCFTYFCNVEGARGRMERKRGTLLVNGMNGQVMEWTPVPAAPVSGMRLEPSIEQAQALERAREKALDLNTRVVHLKREKGSVTVYEKMTLRPLPDAVKLDYRGLVFLPVWCIEGGNGAVVLDALDGRVVKEDFFSEPAAGRENAPTK